MQGLHRFRLVLFELIVSLAFPALSFAESTSFPALELLLAKPEAQIDYAQAKLTVDLLIDPKQQNTNTLQQINAWTMRIKARLPANATRRATLDTLISTLYVPGHWNDYRPF